MGTAGYHAIRSTAKLYGRVLISAARRIGGQIAVFLLLSVVTVIVMTAADALPAARPAVTSLMRGVVSALLLSLYFSCVAVTVTAERISFIETFRRARDLVLPLSTVLFLVFTLSVITAFIFGTRSTAWMRLVVSLGVTICFNALFEVIVFSGERGFSAFRSSFAFVADNTVEWFLPIFGLALGCIVLCGFDTTYRGMLAVSTLHPFQLLNIISGLLCLRLLVAVPLTALGLWCLLYGCFVFRGILYRELGAVPRRKRIFEDRFL